MGLYRDYESAEKSQRNSKQRAEKTQKLFLTNLDPIWYVTAGFFALGFALKLFSDANGDNAYVVAGWAVLAISLASIFLGGFLYFNKGVGDDDESANNGFGAIKHKLIPAILLLISSLAFIGGEVNTASNVGAGAEVFKQKAGTDLQFKTLVEGSNVTITEGNDEITIALSSAASAGTLSTIKEDDVQVGDADIVTLDLGDGFDVTEAPNTEVNLTVDPLEFNITEDALLVGAGTTATYSVVPDCDTAATSKLLYDQTTNAFSCGTDQTGAGSATIDVEEDEVSVDSSVTNIDFKSGFDVTSSPAGEANIAFDITEISLTNDSIWVGSASSLATAVAITDCDDTSGNHLNYDTTTNAFSCGTSSSITDTDTHANAEEDNVVVVTDPSAFDFQDGFDVSADTGEANVALDFLEFNVTDDSVILGAGTTSTLALLPDCNTATTSKLLYDQATNAFSCGTDQSSGSDPVDIEDDNVSEQVDASVIDFGTNLDVACVTGECDITIADAFALHTGDTYTGSHDFGGASDLEIPNGTAETPNAAGEIAVDTSNDQLKYFGGAERVLTYQYSKSGVLENPADADNFLIWKLPFAHTITDIFCFVDPADTGESVVIDIQERNSTGDSPVSVDTTITCDNDGAEDDGTLSNGGIDANDVVSIDIGTITGTVTQVNWTVMYTVDAS